MPPGHMRYVPVVPQPGEWNQDAVPGEREQRRPPYLQCRLGQKPLQCQDEQWQVNAAHHHGDPGG